MHACVCLDVRFSLVAGSTISGIDVGNCFLTVPFRDYNLPHYMSHCEHAFKVHGLEATTWLSKVEHWQIWRDHLFAMGKQAVEAVRSRHSFRQDLDGKVALTAHDHELITQKSWQRGLGGSSVTPKRKADQESTQLVLKSGAALGGWSFERASDGGLGKEGQDLQRPGVCASALLRHARESEYGQEGFRYAASGS